MSTWVFWPRWMMKKPRELNSLNWLWKILPRDLLVGITKNPQTQSCPWSRSTKSNYRILQLIWDPWTLMIWLRWHLSKDHLRIFSSQTKPQQPKTTVAPSQTPAPSPVHPRLKMQIKVVLAAVGRVCCRGRLISSRGRRWIIIFSQTKKAVQF